MIKKKLIFTNLIFTILILFGIQANASDPFWEATVYYSDATRTSIMAPSYTKCIINRTAAKENPPQGSRTYGSTKCVPLLDLDKLKDIRELREPRIISDLTFPFPWPPVCLSCPPDLKGKILEHIYPDKHKEVQQLINKYGVETYTNELLELQQNYDVEGFEKELSEIEMNR
ncbi:MAG: hypothetical protein V3U87_03380 [Methylococcaceae bacterium]